MTESTRTAAPKGRPDLLAVLRDTFGPEPIRHIERIAPRAGRPAEWPSWAHPALVAALRQRGITAPWQHQADAAEIAHAGQSVVISTGTASGKSLAYQLPVLTGLLDDAKACALYLAPTKALAADQLESFTALDLPGIRPGPYDGDTPLPDRDWARDHARLILTNPDMVHVGMLPYHARWSRLLRRLRYIIVDECHYYRGVFGSHVALTLRRLRRMAAYYGAEPTFVCASATVADPARSAGRLVGLDVRAVTDDAAPHPGAEFVLWEPPLVPEESGGQAPGAGPGGPAGSDVTVGHDAGEDEHDAGPGPGEPAGYDEVTGAPAAPQRRSASAEAARMMAAFVATGTRTLTFIRSRAGAEQAAITARRILTRTAPGLAGTVASYRGGYLPEDRRALESAFDSGDLVGVASTNALELGVDIAGIDAAVLAGYPGTIASMWQQAGRAGRGDRPAVAVFIARDDPLDSYLVHHPDAVFGTPVEAAVTNPSNPYVLAPHLACAAAENRLTDDDLDLFGGEAARAALERLLADKVLRRRPTGYYFAGRHHPADTIGLRASGRQVAVVEADTGLLLGTEDAARACASLHPQAVYLHRGRSYVVDDLDLDGGAAFVRADDPAWTTVARSVTSVTIEGTDETTELAGGIRLSTGTVCATEQVVGYLRRRPDGMLIDVVGLTMPEHSLTTHGVWYTVPREQLLDAGIAEGAIGGALHAAEHAAIGLLPLFAECDRWDIGGLSTALHPDTGEPTVIVYDGYPGGAGFAEHGFAIAEQWLSAVHDTIAACPCAAGCPSCVQSPKCGNGNHPLDKGGALIVLRLVIAALRR